ncbi:hypothetical protein [Desulfospira joergensenii]|uniref:hypothetical protein n=1 Tax=Desulfospira joergensenii TaxID=53329 RepID=UPI0003B64358|nr:hypothetical protein [Desulfospira joergensenii]
MEFLFVLMITLWVCIIYGAYLTCKTLMLLMEYERQKLNFRKPKSRIGYRTGLTGLIASFFYVLPPFFLPGPAKDNQWLIIGFVFLGTIIFTVEAFRVTKFEEMDYGDCSDPAAGPFPAPYSFGSRAMPWNFPPVTSLRLTLTPSRRLCSGLWTGKYSIF